jgi:hypothetical protein
MGRKSEICNHIGQEDYRHYHLLPRTHTPVRHRNRALVSDEIGEEVREDPKQREARNSVSGQNPRTAAFVMMLGRGGLLCFEGDDGSPIFHA